MLWDNTLWQLFEKGGFAMWPLLACSLVGTALIVDRVLVLWWHNANYDRFVNRIRPLVVDGRFPEAKRLLTRMASPLAFVTNLYLEHWESSAELRDKAITLAASRQIGRLERRMSWLAMIASVATMLGLLGTVTGLVSAFHQIEVQSGHVQPGDLAAGIWEALITTVYGLVIAVPCLAAYHLLDSRVGAMATELEWIVLQLDAWAQSSDRPLTLSESGAQP